MNVPQYRNTLIAAAVAASLGFGATACGRTSDPSSAEVRSGSATEARAEQTAAGTRTAGDNGQDAVSDTWITTKVKSLLLADSEARSLAVSVETRKGVVHLEGALEGQQAIDHVRDIAAGVEGVRRVDTSAMTTLGHG